MANFSLLAKLGVDTKGFQEGLGKAKGSVGKFKGALGSLGGVIASVGLTSMAREAINLGSKISDMAVQLQISSDALQVLEFSARKAGVETGIMERAIRNVQLRTQQGIEGNKRYAEAYQTLGLSIEEVNRLSPEKKLEAIARASQMATDKQAAYNAVAAILGERAGPKMQEVLQDLAKNGYGSLEEAAKKSGEVMDKDTIAKMDAAADKIESVKRRFTVLTGEILTKVIPAFEILKNGLGFLGEVIGTNILNFKAFFSFLGSAISSVIEPAVIAFDSLSKGIEGAAQAAAGNFKESKAALSEATDLAEKSFGALKDIPKEISDSFSEATKDVKNNFKSLGNDLEKRAGGITNAWREMWGDMVTKSRETSDAVSGSFEGTSSSIKKKAGKDDTRGDFIRGLTKPELLKAANKAAKEDGRRFERMADGTFQEFINGRKGKIVTEEQLKKAVEAKIESKPTEKLLEQIKMVLEGKFVNE